LGTKLAPCPGRRRAPISGAANSLDLFDRKNLRAAERGEQDDLVHAIHELWL
jgi:hypothetical protein